jgi:hypothetical protein
LAITAAQRTTAVALLVQAYNSPAILNQLIPGLTPATLVADIVAAIGTSFDAALTTCLSNAVSQLDTALTGVQAQVTALQAQITADTVV